MIPTVADNPFCILGVWADSTQEQLFDDNYRPTDAIITPTEELTDEAFDNAVEQLTQPLIRIKYALFWFFDPNNKDKLFSLINSSTQALMEQNIEESVVYMMRFLSTNNSLERFIEALGLGSRSIKITDLWGLYFNELSRYTGIERAAKAVWSAEDRGITEHWSEITQQLVITYIDREVIKAQFVCGDHAAIYLEAAVMLMNNCRHILPLLKERLNTDSTEYITLANRVAAQAKWCLEQFKSKQHNGPSDQRVDSLTSFIEHTYCQPLPSAATTNTVTDTPKGQKRHLTKLIVIFSLTLIAIIVALHYILRHI